MVTRQAAKQPERLDELRGNLDPEVKALLGDKLTGVMQLQQETLERIDEMKATLDRIEHKQDLIPPTRRSPSTSSSQSPEELRRIQEEKDLRMKAREEEKAARQALKAEFKAKQEELKEKFRSSTKSNEKVTNKRAKKTDKTGSVDDMDKDMAVCAAEMRNGV